MAMSPPPSTATASPRMMSRIGGTETRLRAISITRGSLGRNSSGCPDIASSLVGPAVPAVKSVSNQTEAIAAGEWPASLQERQLDEERAPNDGAADLFDELTRGGHGAAG